MNIYLFINIFSLYFKKIMQNIKSESLSLRSALQQNGGYLLDADINWGVISSLCSGINVLNYKNSVEGMDINHIISYFIKQLNPVIILYI